MGLRRLLLRILPRLPALVLLAVILKVPIPAAAEDADLQPLTREALGKTKVAAPGPAGRPSKPPSAEGYGIGIEEAIPMALENNRALVVERVRPAIRETCEAEAGAEFDPVASGSAGYRVRNEERFSDSTPVVSSGKREDAEAAIGLSQRFSTGTTAGIELSANSSQTGSLPDLYQSRIGLSVTQPLLRGAGRAANLANLRQAVLSTRASQYEFRGFAEALVAEVEVAYWDYTLARRRIDIVGESLSLAGQQVRETTDLISVGRLAEAELPAAEAEMALRRQELIDARSLLSKSRIRLLRLIHPPGKTRWDLEIVPLDAPIVPDAALEDADTSVEAALRLRADLNEARLEMERGDLEVVKTRNGLLPVLDVFINLGKSGYAESFGDSVRELDGESYDVLAGLRMEWPIGRRAERARLDRSLLEKDRLRLAMDNLAQLVELDIHTARIEVERSREQIAATAAVRRLQEEKLRIETEKFKVGRSTNFLVAQAQRDLVSSRISEVEAVISLLNAMTDLYRLEGSLLLRRGLEAPGAEPPLQP